MRTYSDLLYARPSFLEGVARIFDLGNTMNEYNDFATGEEADAIALWSDWTAIGQDISDAMGEFVIEEFDAVIPED